MCMEELETVSERKPRVVAIAQARMASTRLPGKVMMEVLGRPLVHYHMTRLARARLVDQAVLATTNKSGDDPLVGYCKDTGLAFFRGSEEDALERYVECAREFEADIIVRTTCDCPLIDPEIIDQAIALFVGQAERPDHFAPVGGAFPRGFDLEVVPRRSLETAHRDTQDPYDREHVTSYLYRHQKRFKVVKFGTANLTNDYRLCVDETADFELVSRIIADLHPSKPDFGWLDVIALLEAHPDWAHINRHVEQKPVAPAID